MKTFNNIAAQGDLLIRRIETLPEGMNRVDNPADGKLIVAHSETGHHHYLNVKDSVEYYMNPSDPNICFLRTEVPLNLIHARPTHTHETIQIPPGVFEFRRQQEYTPQGWRQVQD